MDAADVVKNLALEGSAHFHASYVAKQLGIPTAKAHEELAGLERKGVLEVHFDVICPETDRTILSFGLREEVPVGEMVIEETGDCEPFELTESDLLVTYSPTQDYTRRLLRNGDSSRLKKKRSILARIPQIVSRLHRLTASIHRADKSSSRIARGQRSSRRASLPVGQ